MDVGEFYRVTRDVAKFERQRDEATKQLKKLYDELVPGCPHPEAVDFNHGIRGWGTHRRCVVCGVWDHGSEGGTPGDEYDYGYPGHPSKEFWKNTKVTVTEDKEVWESTSKGHHWQVRGGKAVNLYA